MNLANCTVLADCRWYWSGACREEHRRCALSQSDIPSERSSKIEASRELGGCAVEIPASMINVRQVCTYDQGTRDDRGIEGANQQSRSFLDGIVLTAHCRLCLRCCLLPCHIVCILKLSDAGSQQPRSTAELIASLHSVVATSDFLFPSTSSSS